MPTGTLRFIPYAACKEYGASTRMSQEAFYPGIYTYVGTNNFPGRFFYPGRQDNESLVAFDWIDQGRQHSSSLLW